MKDNNMESIKIKHIVEMENGVVKVDELRIVKYIGDSLISLITIKKDAVDELISLLTPYTKK